VARAVGAQERHDSYQSYTRNEALARYYMDLDSKPTAVVLSGGTAPSDHTVATLFEAHYRGEFRDRYLRSTFGLSASDVDALDTDVRASAGAGAGKETVMVHRLAVSSGDAVGGRPGVARSRAVGGQPGDPFGVKAWVGDKGLVVPRADSVGSAGQCGFCTVLLDVHTAPEGWGVRHLGYNPRGLGGGDARVCRLGLRYYSVRVGGSRATVLVVPSVGVRDLYGAVVGAMWCTGCRAPATSCRCRLSNTYALAVRQLALMRAVCCQGWCESRLGTLGALVFGAKIAKLMLSRGVEL